MYVITIGRTFGSGGRELGRRIAEKLGIPFYDKLLLEKAAEKAGLKHEFMIHNDEKPPKFLGGASPFGLGFYTGGGVSAWFNDPASGADTIYKAQSDFIHDIASHGPCVIVGRTADYILRDMPNVINIFVHAPMEDCVERILKRSPELSTNQAKNLAQRTNRLRANFYEFYTDKKWGHPSSYHLTLDSSKLPIDSLADIVIHYLNEKIK